MLQQRLEKLVQKQKEIKSTFVPWRTANNNRPNCYMSPDNQETLGNFPIIICSFY